MGENSRLISDVLLKTNPALYASIDGGNSWLASIIQRGARVKLYRDYERGDHRADMTTQMRSMLRLRSDSAGLDDFNDNYCRLVIDKMAGRVSISEVSTGDESIDQRWLEPLLDKQDFQAAEGMWWRGAITDGDAFVMVDPVTMLWSSEPAYDGFSGMIAIYNQLTRKPVWACKIWSESDIQDQAEGGLQQVIYLVVYEPERITFWKGEDGGGEVEPAPQTDGQSERLWPVELNGSLPFVSYANQRNNYTRYGDSEIRSAIPLQDVLNRTIYSMVMASEFAAFGVNWSIGMKINPAGIVPGGIINMTLNNSDGTAITDFTAEQISFLQACKLGQFPATDISQYTNQIEKIVKEISQATQTPIYGITAGGAISGDALKQLEIGLIGKCQRFQRQNTDAIKELIMLTAKMERVFSPGLGTPEINSVQITWKSPEILDNNAQIASLLQMYKDAPGLWADSFYQQKIGKLFGMSKEDINDEILQADKEKAESIESMSHLQSISLNQTENMEEEV
ncbi:MAG: phage portal protein [Smithella sp.]